MKTSLTLAFCISCLVDLSAASPALPAQNNASMQSHPQYGVPCEYADPYRKEPQPAPVAAKARYSRPVYFSHCQCFELPVCYVEPNRDVPVVTKDAVFADDDENGKQALQDWQFVLLHGDEFPGR